MKLTKTIFILAALLALTAQPSFAIELEGLDRSATDRSNNSGWQLVKSQVKNWWGKIQMNTDGRGPASETQQPVAAVPAEQEARPPVEQQATPDNWRTTPIIVAMPQKPQPNPKNQENAAKMKSLATTVSGASLTKQVRAAKAPSTHLPLTKSGVPTFSLFQSTSEKSKKGTKAAKIPVKEIPLLDIGTEASVIHQDFTLEDILLATIEKRKFEELSTPQILGDKEFRKILGIPIVAVPQPTQVKISSLEDDQKVTPDKVQRIDYKVALEKNVEEVVTRPLTPDEMKFLRALILYEQKDKCHVAAGLFHDLGNIKEYESSANFYLGICLHKMGLFSESVDRLIRAIESDDPAYTVRGTEVITSDLPAEFEVRVGKTLESALKKVTVSKDVMLRAHFIIAKGALKREAFAQAHEHADKIPSGDILYGNAQYIMSVSEYGLGQGPQALSRLERLKTYLEKKSDPDLMSLVAINLGRVAFQEKKFKESAKHFLSISKGHPLWIQALTEQAWAQIMAGDNEGAIGNMHSIQSPFFNTVYKPESYVVRTIGYISLCQYPDAYRSLARMEHEYRGWLTKMQQFTKNTKAPKDFYVTMARYLASSSQTEIGGLPFQVLREMGRHRDYLNLQESINHRIDEQEQYGFLKGMIKKDIEKATWLKAQARARLVAIDAKIAASKKNESLFKELNQLKQDKATEHSLIDYFDFQISVFNEGRESLKKFEDKASRKLAVMKDDLILKAGDVLKKRLFGMVKDLEVLFDNNEFLRYEVFAGSGENIRHDMAGGEKRVVASAKPVSKDLSWNFDGEFWEDEIGHYKSSLKDNCPKNQAAR
jgi:tetratricopeptide (TPR) repeat protein